ncbi:hypothetical protein ACKC9G_18420 [Pokkaliibacter sp. CJK22405]|uniref:hypothetical protein n=1 Tax=Pokkaliibacter sp. CJK22405 TaxID=3384615 RepID=UPI0039855D9E
MKTIILHGSLKARFGGPFSFDVRDPAEAVAALCSQLEGFRYELEAGEFRVSRGNAGQLHDIDQAGLMLAMGAAKELHIAPVISGGKGGAGKVIVGIAMVVAAFYTGGATLAGTAFTVGGVSVSAASLALFGASMAIGGIASMQAKVPGTASADQIDARSSYLFSAPTNVSSEGGVVPLVYGEVFTGSTVISSGISTERVAL